MKETVYVETSVFGYLTGRQSRDLVAAARQAITQDWWENSRKDFTLFISVLVRGEGAAGDKDAATRRLDAMKGIRLLEIVEDAVALSGILLEKVPFPERYTEDALHIAVASVSGMDYLLTWNFKHINNAQMKNRVQQIVEHAGYVCPIICSPEELRSTGHE